MRLASMTLGLVLTFPALVCAQTQDATRAAGRQLATEGVNAYQAGDYRTAVDKLRRAYDTVTAPSIGLWLARALEKRGRLVQASELYLEVIRLDPKTGDEAVQREAQASARQEHDALQPRIATFTLDVKDRNGEEPLLIKVDGVVVPNSLLGVPIPADPGHHVIEVTQGSRRGTGWSQLKEGERSNVTVTLGGASQSPPRDTKPTPAMAPAPAPAAPAPASRPAPPALGSAEPDSTVPTLVVFGLAASGVALAAGTVTGILAVKQHAELSPRCPDSLCDPVDADGVSRLHTLRNVSTLGFALGAVGLAGTGVLWFTRPNKSTKAFVRPTFGVAALGVEGKF